MSDRDERDIVGSSYYVWLDDSIKTTHRSQVTVQKIRDIVKDRLCIYDEPDFCIDDITYDGITERIYLIVSNKLGANVVPLIINLPQIEAVYIYCSKRHIAESWSKTFSKVRKICTKENELIGQISADVQGGDAANVIPMSAFRLDEQGNSVHKLSPQSTKFMWYQLAMHVLPMMSEYFNAKEDMANEARKRYHDDEFEKRRIDRFVQEYKAEKAFCWYTSDSFVYRLLNGALRTQDIDIIFKFRFFINHLHNEIKERYKEYLAKKHESHLTVYRGQLMSMNEVEFLKNSVNQIVSMNSFLSTSLLLNVAKQFLNSDGSVPDKSSEQSVLFIINISDIDETTTPFAFIKTPACAEDLEGEKEVLFTMNAIFKVESVNQEGHIWHVHLQLIEHQNEQQKIFSRYLIEAVESDPGPTVFGWFLYRMNDFDRAERYVQYIIQQPLEESEKAAAYNLLGLIYSDRKMHKKAIEYYQEAIKIYDNAVRVGSPQIISIHHNITLAYLAGGNTQHAEHHRRIVEKLLDGLYTNKEPLLIAMSEALQGKVAAACGNYEKALENLTTSLKVKEKSLPANHSSIVDMKYEMGVIYAKIGNNEEALNCFEQVAAMNETSLLADDFNLAECHANIGRIRYKREEYQLALEQFEKAKKIITDATREDEEILTELLICIKDTQDKIAPLSPEIPDN